VRSGRGWEAPSPFLRSGLASSSRLPCAPPPPLFAMAEEEEAQPEMHIWVLTYLSERLRSHFHEMSGDVIRSEPSLRQVAGSESGVAYHTQTSCSEP